MSDEENQLKQEFLNNIDYDQLISHKLPRVIVISFIASIGSGKSTISEILSKKLSIPILDNDGIRRFLNTKGYPGESPLPELVIDIARSRMKIVLEKKISYILDADLTLTYSSDIERIRSMGGQLLLIKIDCPEKLILNRIDKRMTSDSTSLATKERYFERQKIRNNVSINPESIFFTIDNSINLDLQIDKLLIKIDEFENNSETPPMMDKLS